MKILSKVSLLFLIFGAKDTLAQKKKPNVLIILADDVGTGDVPGYWGNEIVDMPNLRALQEKGVTFMNAHSTPLCAPSRYSLLSGNYPHRGENQFGTWDFHEGQNQFLDMQQSIAEMLKMNDESWHTSMFGKWHIGGKVPGTYSNQTYSLSCCDNDWSQPMGQGPNEIGFDESFYTMGGIQSAPYSFFRNGYLTTKEEDITMWEVGNYTKENGISIINKPGEGDPSWDSSDYNMKLVKEAYKFLDNHVADRSQDPFFMYFALGQVHIPHSPPFEYLDGTKIAGKYENPHLDLLFEMDLVIGSLMTKLEETNLMKDTIVIFCSDNGGLDMGYPNRILRDAKSSIYEGGHRVPFTMRYDGVVPAGEVRDEHYISLVDVYATIAEFTGSRIDQYSAQDSKSFAEYAKSAGNTAGLRKYLHTWSRQRQKEFSTPNNKEIVRAESIHFGDMKYIRYLAPHEKEELYNLKTDIGETRNLLEISPGTYEKLRKKLQNKLRQEGFCPFDKAKSKLKNGKKRGQTVNCNWFKQDPQRRCRWQRITGEKRCNSICGRFRWWCRFYNPDLKKSRQANVDL